MIKLNSQRSGLIVSLLSAATLLAAPLQVSAYDFSVTDTEDHTVYYDINADGSTLSVAQGPDGYNYNSLKIPQTVSYNGKEYTVSQIAAGAFRGAGIKVVELPNTITDINEGAFENSALAQLNWPTSLKRIHNYAFSSTSIQNAILPSGVQTIGDGAFYSVPIETLTLPETLTDIGIGAFYGAKIKDLSVPGGIRTVRQDVFAHCTLLKRVELGEGLERIEDAGDRGGAFGVSALETVIFPSTLKYIGDGAFSNCEFKTIRIPDTVTGMGDWCFSDNKKLESITFSSGMNRIPNSVCARCELLTEMIIPQGIVTIGSSIINADMLISHIDLPESVTEVEKEAFANSGLVGIKFPSNLTYVGEQMFNRCRNMTEISIPANIKEIRDFAFWNCTSLRKVTLPEGLSSIGQGAFMSCQALEEINIPVNIGKIARSMFQGCASLREVVIPEGIKSVEYGAFEDCANLETLRFPESLELLEAVIFDGCDKLKTITLYHNTATVYQTVFAYSSLEEVHLYRAVVPETPRVQPSDVVERPVIPAGNNCTLYVPVGSAESYKANPLWNTFSAIVEEETPYVAMYQISTESSVDHGQILVNGVSLDGVMSVETASKAVITAVPDEGYHLVAFTVNGEDAMNAIAEGGYVIESVSRNYIVGCSFEKDPYLLSIYTAEGGGVAIEVNEGERVSCTFIEEKGWKLNTVMFNNTDVTSELDGQKHYTTPAITGNSEIRASFVSDSNGIEAAAVPSDLKAFVGPDGVLVVKGLPAGSAVRVYSVAGLLMGSTVSDGDDIRMQLAHRGIYLVETGEYTFKLQY